MSEFDPTIHPEFVSLAWEAAQASNRVFDKRRLSELNQVQSVAQLAIEGASAAADASLDQTRSDAEDQYNLLISMAAPIMLLADSPFSASETAAVKADDLMVGLLTSTPNKTFTIEELSSSIYEASDDSDQTNRGKIRALIYDAEQGRSDKICHELLKNRLVLQVGRKYDYDAANQQRKSTFTKVARAVAMTDVADNVDMYSTEVADQLAEIDWQTIPVIEY